MQNRLNASTGAETERKVYASKRSICEDIELRQKYELLKEIVMGGLAVFLLLLLGFIIGMLALIFWLMGLFDKVNAQNADDDTFYSRSMMRYQREQEQAVYSLIMMVAPVVGVILLLLLGCLLNAVGILK